MRREVSSKALCREVSNIVMEWYICMAWHFYGRICKYLLSLAWYGVMFCTTTQCGML